MLFVPLGHDPNVLIFSVFLIGNQSSAGIVDCVNSGMAKVKAVVGVMCLSCIYQSLEVAGEQISPCLVSDDSS